MSFHIGAEPDAIAKTVLLPGDPLRAEYVAKNFLDEPVLYNRVRGMLGFTGYYRGHRVSVQGTGMGIPSAMIYAHELVRDYGVENLVRIGSSGSMQRDLGVHSLVLAMSACTDSAVNRRRFRGADFAPTASFSLLQRAVAAARAQELPVRVGSVLSTDEFYPDGDLAEHFRVWAEHGVLCAEMETAGLYTIAAKYRVHALSILTISDALYGTESITAEDRERGLDRMIKLALGMLEIPQSSP